MWTRLSAAIGVILVATGLGAAGCSFTSGASDGSSSAITGRKFDKNHLLDDAVLMDDRAVTAAQIQTFLERTPYGTSSPLAGYRDDNGAPASVLLHDAAVSYGVNPITLLVRIEMENGLISASAAATVDASVAGDGGLATPVPGAIQTKIENAFNCGRVLGLEGQAGCATRAVARAMMLLEDGQEANGGWKRGVALKTKDNVTVTPSNAATAAVYVYTPYVGESGGGAKGTAGAAGHMGLWDLFAKALKYKGATCPVDASSCTTDDAGTDDSDGGSADIDAGGDNDAASTDTDAGTDPDAAVDPDAGDVDASAPSSDAGHADAGKGGGGKKDASATVPGDDGEGDGTGHQTGSSGSSSGSYGSFPPGSNGADDADAGDSGSAAGKKGCSTTGGGGGSSDDAATFALLLGLAVVTARRRREGGSPH